MEGAPSALCGGGGGVSCAAWVEAHPCSRRWSEVCLGIDNPFGPEFNNYTVAQSCPQECHVEKADMPNQKVKNETKPLYVVEPSALEAAVQASVVFTAFVGQACPDNAEMEMCEQSLHSVAFCHALEIQAAEMAEARPGVVEAKAEAALASVRIDAAVEKFTSFVHAAEFPNSTLELLKAVPTEPKKKVVCLPSFRAEVNRACSQFPEANRQACHWPAAEALYCELMNTVTVEMAGVKDVANSINKYLRTKLPVELPLGV